MSFFVSLGSFNERQRGADMGQIWGGRVCQGFFCFGMDGMGWDGGRGSTGGKREYWFLFVDVFKIRNGWHGDGKDAQTSVKNVNGINDGELGCFDTCLCITQFGESMFVSRVDLLCGGASHFNITA